VAGPNGELDWVKVDQENFGHVGMATRNGRCIVWKGNLSDDGSCYWPTAEIN